VYRVGLLYKLIIKLSISLVCVAQGDQKVSVYSNNTHTIDDMKMTITEYIRNVDRAILNVVFEIPVRCVNIYLETGGGHFGHYL
jgi:hypothetical protein